MGTGIDPVSDHQRSLGNSRMPTRERAAYRVRVHHHAVHQAQADGVQHGERPATFAADPDRADPGHDLEREADGGERGERVAGEQEGVYDVRARFSKETPEGERPAPPFPERARADSQAVDGDAGLAGRLRQNAGMREAVDPRLEAFSVQARGELDKLALRSAEIQRSDDITDVDPLQPRL